MSTIENKIKLSLRPSLGSIGSDKTHHPTPPTKLLINHGKPNYTINRSVAKARQQERQQQVKQQQQQHTTKSPAVTNESNGLPKVTLKKTSVTPTTLLPPSFPVKKSSISSLNGITINGDTSSSTSSTKDEFFEKRKRIFEKIERENSVEENGYLNRIENSANNGLTTQLTLSPPISPNWQQTYVRKISDQLQNETNIKSSISTLQRMQSSEQQYANLNGHSNRITNGHVSHDMTDSPSEKIKLTNGNPTLNHLNSTPVIPSSPNGNANFEQKTIVSFSKDLASESNKYPDTVKVLKPTASVNGTTDNTTNVSGKEEVLQELTKLKFDIHVQKDVVVKPVIRSS